VKKVFAILFVIALVFGQVLATPVSPVSCAVQAAPCCGCGGAMKCCVNNSGQSNQPAPAPLPSQSSQNDFQLLQLSATKLLLYSEAPDSRVFPQRTDSSRSTDAPLFTRNCAFLI
jgi:hypothetical protein